jgi:hypothetical protein
MKKLFLTIILLLAPAAIVPAQVPATTVLKPTLSVRAQRDLNYWKMPDAPNYWSWMPKVSFTVTGPIEDASFFTFEFTTPDGKPWYSWDTQPVSVPAGGWYNVESEAVSSWRDKRSTILTGVFGFKVTLKNNLLGASKEMYKGTFKVNKSFAGTPHPDFKNQYAFYVDQDWALPIGTMAFNLTDPASPFLAAGMWFRGDFDSDRLAAYVFYNGKQISSTKNSSLGASVRGKALIAEGDDKREFYWVNWNFVFYNLRQADPAGNYPAATLLKNNPGNYEIKVLLDGELARTVAFTVGPNGEIVDSGIAAKNGFAGMGTIVPVKVIGNKEGTLNLQSWKTDAFYGNPLTGFTAQ